MRTLLCTLLLLTPLAVADSKPLVIHEWGTFTSLQDETGRTIGGVNVDDETLPKFVHRLGERKPNEAGATLEIFGGKSLYPGAPSVTMRLETPVLYFYPPDDKPITLDITATFNGGLLSEFFPDAAVTVDGKPWNRSAPETIPLNTRGAITWKNVTINTDKPWPQTDEHVWLAPRAVPAAAPVQIGDEAEKYIFYRGVGRLDAPLKVLREGDDAIKIIPSAQFKFGPMWLAEFRADGRSAFRKVDVGSQPGAFTDADFASDNVTDLRALMKQALVADGLFSDEAEAMLETWKLSYFKSVGQRLFFLVPKGWTDQVLPLEISKPAQVTRVMIGRIELVKPQQRQAIVKLADSKNKLDVDARNALMRSLGRFAAPLVNDAHRQQREAARNKPVAAAN